MTHFKFLRTTCWALLIALSTTIAVHAHGTLEHPASRSWTCWMEGPESPDSAACQEAVRIGGTQPIYDWDEINQYGASENHQEFIEDGELCSASRERYAGLNLARDDWPKTSIFPDENGRLLMLYNASAPHVTDYWRFYLTKDDWDPLEPLKWSDLEDEPFCELGNLPPVGERGDQHYEFDCPMPTEKEGYHLLYLIQQRGDTIGAYYSCSDVIVTDIEPTPTPTIIEPCASHSYDDIVAYLEGDTVVFNMQVWEARWWVKGHPPGTNSAWQVVEGCMCIIIPIPTPIPDSLTSCQSQLPDLTITSSRLVFDARGCRFTGVQFTVVNQSANPSSLFTVESVDTGEVQTFSDLLGGESVQVVFEGVEYYGNTPSAIVDPSNLVPESDETNNTFEESIPIPTRPVHCSTPETSTATPTQSIVITPTPTGSTDVPLNIGHSAGSNKSSNNVVVLFAVALSLGLLGAVTMISGRKQ